MNPWKIYTVFSILSTWFTDFWCRNNQNVRVIKRLHFFYHCFALRRIIPVWDVYLNCFFCCHALPSLHFLLSLAWKVPWLPSVPFIYGQKNMQNVAPCLNRDCSHDKKKILWLISLLENEKLLHLEASLSNNSLPYNNG